MSFKEGQTGINSDYGRKAAENIQLILEELIPEIKSTDYLGRGDAADRRLSVDLQIHHEEGDQPWAVKFRRPNQRHFDDVTIETWNGDETKGDWFRFAGGGVIKYVYGWALEIPVLEYEGNVEKFLESRGGEPKGIPKEFLILDAKKLTKIPSKHFNKTMNGGIKEYKPVTGGKKVGCNRNKMPSRGGHGLAWFTAISLRILKKRFPETIEEHYIDTGWIDYLEKEESKEDARAAKRYQGNRKHLPKFNALQEFQATKAA